MHRSSTESLLRIPDLDAQPGLVHGFSTLALGSMRGPAPDGSPLTPERMAFAAALGLDGERITAAGAVHGVDVARIDEPSGVVPRHDAMVTDQPGLPLLLTFADCYPVVLYDPVRRALALAHAGWRGSAAAIAERTVETLGREYGCRPADLVAGLGPGICGRCYEVGEEVAARFDPACTRQVNGGSFQLDLAAVNRAQLARAGVLPGRIHAHGACTRESPGLPSHRRSPDGARFACLAALT